MLPRRRVVDEPNSSLAASAAAKPASATATITGVSGSLSHSVTTAVTVSAVNTGTVAVDLSSAYNANGIYTNGSTFAPAASLDGGGWACSAEVLGSTQVGDGVVFKLGPAYAPDVVTGKTITLPAGKFVSVKVLATGVNGSQERQIFTVTFEDGPRRRSPGASATGMSRGISRTSPRL